jgi:hypothetical protein
MKGDEEKVLQILKRLKVVVVFMSDRGDVLIVALRGVVDRFLSSVSGPNVHLTSLGKFNRSVAERAFH